MPVYLELLHDGGFYEFLLQIDRDLAEQVRRSGCRFCGAPLHSACYGRRPRGVPAGVRPGPGFGVCYSFCCSAEGCRRRHRAPSVRFLGRRVYLSVMVALLTAMRQGPSRRTVGRLKALFGVDRRTLCRWRRWWRRIFPRSGWWRRTASRFMPAIDEGQLPQALIDAFGGHAPVAQVLGLLSFLSSIGSVFF